MEPFAVSNLMFLASPWLEIFKLIILLTWSSSKLIFILLTLENDPNCLFLLPLGRLQLFCWLWVRSYTAINNPNPYLLTKNSTTSHGIMQKSFSIIQPAVIKNWVPRLINRLQEFSLLLLSVTCFADLHNNKITMVRIKTQKVLYNWENIF